jgi:hypothetical protein
VRDWDAAGRPKPSRRHTAFQRWSEIIGGIVEFAGYGCPLATAEIPSAADVDGADMRELVNLLADSEPLKFDKLVELSREHGIFERIIGSGDGELKRRARNRISPLLPLARWRKARSICSNQSRSHEQRGLRSRLAFQCYIRRSRCLEKQVPTWLIRPDDGPQGLWK